MNLTTRTSSSLLCLILTTLSIFLCGMAVSEELEPQYLLAVSFDMGQKELTGTARITIPAGKEARFDIEGLELTAIVLGKSDGSVNEAMPKESRVLFFAAEEMERTIYISYKYRIRHNPFNRIEKDGIVLLHNWYPQPEKKFRYQLKAQLPPDFTAVSQSTRFPLSKEGQIVTADTPSPIDTLQLIAAPYLAKRLQVRDGLFIHALFYPEDIQLAPNYLSKGRDYILRYEREIGPFPYNHFVIVANKLPTGYGMGSFTLIGQRVLRLPFIVDTSLGHEIVHAWFGNSVGVEYSQGNWCEGLTSYLADHAFRRDRNEGSTYRKEQIVNFTSYAHDDNTIPLKEFVAASHTGLQGRASRAVGYSRSMMFFHELSVRIGNEAFNRGIKALYSTYAGKTASWSDLQKIFEKSAATELTTFFEERLSRTTVPDLDIRSPQIRSTAKGYRLTFTVMQHSTEPFSIRLPIRVTTGLGHYWFYEDITETATDIELNLPQRPLSFVIDRDNSFMRRLKLEEYPPVWSRFLGSEQPLVILESEEVRPIYQPIVDRFASSDWPVKLNQKVTNRELAEHDLLFLGTGGSAYRSLFATPGQPRSGFSLEVRTNPLNTDRIAVTIDAENSGESAAVGGRLSHYGKYSQLHFSKGKIARKETSASQSGIRIVFEELPDGGRISPTTPFQKTADELSRKDVIYLGEMHTSLSDHRLQLRLIEAIAARAERVAIGMEMFPTSSQEALNRYTLSDQPLSEHQFLKESGYFKHWSYDYRYFRDIFTFARQNKIPVIGLNLERETVSTVFRTGATDSLPEAVKNSLPKDRDLVLPGYLERLALMYSAHSEHARGMESGFIQAQALWDESMAANIVSYLKEHPDTTMIVLAGSQHTRKDSGIPPRVQRRIEVTQASVLNLTGDNIPVDLAEIADYYFLSAPLTLPAIGKIGVHLQPFEKDNERYIRIEKILPHSNAEEAGLKKGDILSAINEIPLTSMDDVRIAMLDAAPGDKIQIVVRRGNKTHVKEVELVRPMPEGHP